jgi:uncharacterized protein (DUF58 family)
VTVSGDPPGPRAQGTASPGATPDAGGGPLLLDALRGVRWLARRTVPGGLPGTHRSRTRGTAGEFTEYRPYRQGDDPRRLDWRLLARSDRAFIRLTDDHALLATNLVVDASLSMAFPADTLGKWRMAGAIATGLAAVAHASGDPVGLLVPTATGVRRLMPRTRHGVVGEIARALAEVRPEGAHPLAPLLAPLAGGGRLVLVSDFLGETDGDDALRSAAAAFAAAGGEVYAVHVMAVEELDPPRRAVLAVDPERPTLRRALVDANRAEYVAAFAEWRASTARRWREIGASFVSVSTAERPDVAVRRVVAPQPAAAARP